MQQRSEATSNSQHGKGKGKGKASCSQMRPKRLNIQYARGSRIAAEDKAATRETSESEVTQRNGLFDPDQEDQDLAEAISRSLADKVAAETEEQCNVDMAETKLMSMAIDDEPGGQASSYYTPKPAAPSNSSAPHVPLYALLEDLETAATTLEKWPHDEDELALNHVADRIRQWHGTVFQVIYALEVVENKRIEDLRMHIDLDREINQKHREQLEQVNKSWEAKMLSNEKLSVQHLEAQREMYESILTEHNIKKPPSPNANYPPAQRAAPAPPPIIAIKRLHEEVQTLKAKRASTIRSMEANHASAISVLKRKVDRLSEENAALRDARKTKGHAESDEEDLDRVGQLHKKGLERLRAASASTNMRPRRKKLLISDQEFEVQIVSRSPSPDQGGKRKTDGGEERRLEGMNWSPKKAKNGHDK